MSRSVPKREESSQRATKVRESSITVLNFARQIEKIIYKKFSNTINANRKQNIIVFFLKLLFEKAGMVIIENM